MKVTRHFGIMQRAATALENALIANPTQWLFGTLPSLLGWLHAMPAPALLPSENGHVWHLGF